VKKLAKIAEAGLGSYVFNKIMVFFVGAPHLPAMLRIVLQAGRWHDDSNFSQLRSLLSNVGVCMETGPDFAQGLRRTSRRVPQRCPKGLHRIRARNRVAIMVQVNLRISSNRVGNYTAIINITVGRHLVGTADNQPAVGPERVQQALGMRADIV